MSGFTVFHPLWAGFYSRPFYRCAAARWRFLSAFAMLVCLTACWLPSLAKFAATLPELSARFDTQILSQWPTLTIDNGVASTPERRPYYLAVNEKTKVPFLTIDVTGQTAALPDGSAPQILITERRVFIRKSAAETRVYDLTNFRHLVVSRDGLKTFAAGIVLAVMPMLLAMSAAKRIVQALLLSLAAWTTAKLFGRSRDYGALLSLSFVAMVPPFVLETLWGLARQSFFGEGLVWAAVLIGFNAWAVIASEPESAAPAPAVPSAP